jgi:predicted kinase
VKSVEQIIGALSERERAVIEHRLISIGRVMDRCPNLIIPVGAPGTGKSTWIKQHLDETTRDVVVLSSDDQIEAKGQAEGKTYSEVYAAGIDMKALESVMGGQLRTAVAERKDIIVDRTNMRVKSRNRWMSQVPKHYVRIALVFELPLAILHQRLFARGVATGKTIPRQVVQDMLGSYEAPSLDEFDVVAFMNEEAALCSTQ